METNGAETPKKNSNRPASLLRQLFQSDSPEKTVRALPAQTLYLLARQIGLSSCIEVIEVCSLEQLRALLDFDLWERDKISESKVWEWLELPEASEDLQILRRVIKAIDLKIVGLLISRYVEAISFDDPSENPPGPQFFTPDKGYTWLQVTNENSREHFLLTRLLAQIFQMDADLFYQLLNIPCLNTQSMLEFESYEERSKRLRSEGVPSEDEAYEFTAPTTLQQVQRLLSNADKRPLIQTPDLTPVLPLISYGVVPEPLKSAVEKTNFDTTLQTMLTHLLNNVLVRFYADMSEPEQVKELIAKALGSINIGLEEVLREEEVEGKVVIQAIGFRPLFCLGLHHIFQLRSKAQKILSHQNIEDPITSSLLEHLSLPFPEFPVFLDGLSPDTWREEDNDKLSAGQKPFEHRKETLLAQNILEEIQERYTTRRLLIF